jgi:hypothetical protein
LAAAFAMNGSLYAMFLYLVLCLQDDLGYSALATGNRILLISGTSIVASMFAGCSANACPSVGSSGRAYYWSGWVCCS